MNSRILCVHCGKHRINRPRVLCWGCYYRPGVRERYGSDHKSAKRGIGFHNVKKSIPEPTDAAPGSEEKIRVMIERAERGELITHPNDSKIDPNFTEKVFVHGFRSGGLRSMVDNRRAKNGDFWAMITKPRK